MNVNVGTVDRVLRVLVGLALITAAATGRIGLWGWLGVLPLATGLFRYEDSGLLDRTHVRWFTRVTMLEMFTQAGWKVEHAFSRRLPQPAPPALLAGIRAIAEAAGSDGEQALQDAEAFQFLFKLRPA